MPWQSVRQNTELDMSKKPQLREVHPHQQSRPYQPALGARLPLRTQRMRPYRRAILVSYRTGPASLASTSVGLASTAFDFGPLRNTRSRIAHIVTKPSASTTI